MKKVGRPRKWGRGWTSIRFPVSQAEMKLIRDAARAAGVTVPEWIRRMVFGG